MEKIIAELEEIAAAAGDNMDREGEYTSDRIRVVIRKLKETQEG